MQTFDLLEFAQSVFTTKNGQLFRLHNVETNYTLNVSCNETMQLYPFLIKVDTLVLREQDHVEYSQLCGVYAPSKEHAHAWLRYSLFSPDTPPSSIDELYSWEAANIDPEVPDYVSRNNIYYKIGEATRIFQVEFDVLCKHDVFAYRNFWDA